MLCILLKSIIEIREEIIQNLRKVFYFAGVERMVEIVENLSIFLFNMLK